MEEGNDDRLRTVVCWSVLLDVWQAFEEREGTQDEEKEQEVECREASGKEVVGANVDRVRGTTYRPSREGARKFCMCGCVGNDGVELMEEEEEEEEELCELDVRARLGEEAEVFGTAVAVAFVSLGLLKAEMRLLGLTAISL